MGAQLSCQWTGLGGLHGGLQDGPRVALALGAFAAVVGTLAIPSHLLADALTPMGIAPYEPVRTMHYSLDAISAANPLANYALLALGLLLAAGATAIGKHIARL